MKYSVAYASDCLGSPTHKTTVTVSSLMIIYIISPLLNSNRVSCTVNAFLKLQSLILLQLPANNNTARRTRQQKYVVPNKIFGVNGLHAFSKIVSLLSLAPQKHTHTMEHVM